MIAGSDVRELEIPFNMRAMLIEYLQDFLKRIFIHLRRLPEKQESGE